ncbi:polyprenol monophosphomannose synthase [Candidatus Parcubacteria bacterium]|nr:polyprenol monophosphomannose synthase [Candidatus Parcubacteria bacterium]
MDTRTGRGALVVIPTYNEAENISRLITDLFYRYSEIAVLVVDDASPDGTARRVEKLKSNYPALALHERPAKLGLGSAYREAFQKVLAWSGVEAIITMDADFSHDPASVSALLDALRGVDVAIGSRYAPGGAVVNWPLSRRLLSRFANRYTRSILRVALADFTAGFHAIRREALARLSWPYIKTDGYGFLIELKYRLLRAGATICEVPITFTERRQGVSKLSRRTMWEAALLPWRLRFRHPAAD